MMSDIVVSIIVLLILTYIFWMGWALGKSKYIHTILKKEPPKTIKELEKELDEALDIEDYESAIKINKIIHNRLKKNKST